jgi:hypothetical protein
MLVAGLIGFGGVAVFGFQCLWWLRDGYWTQGRLGELWYQLGFPYPALSWAGIERIVLWIFDLPLSGGLILIAVIVGWIANSLSSARFSSGFVKGNNAFF